jgi:hypothetical protein
MSQAGSRRRRELKWGEGGSLILGCGWRALPQLKQHALQAFLGLGDVGVVGAEPGRKDCQGTLVAGSGHGQFTQDAVHVAEVCEEGVVTVDHLKDKGTCTAPED